ncbi:hypothetical protein SAMN05421507_13051 [Lentzea jiangxiensis]|uniref:Uncharacterized protein n=1 Tax=Lentzea jiangxiensis TaxID=641025 RepID=A0A1H0X4C8_9PSEU|nr:hypothetical protein SAMN05421507_13051 [Lentzea jiangxiensis]
MRPGERVTHVNLGLFLPTVIVVNDQWAGEAALRWRACRRRGRHAREPAPSSQSLLPAVLGVVLLVCLILLLLTYL